MRHPLTLYPLTFKLTSKYLRVPHGVISWIVKILSHHGKLANTLTRGRREGSWWHVLSLSLKWVSAKYRDSLETLISTIIERWHILIFGLLLFWILNRASREEKETFQDWIGSSFYFPCSNSWSLLLLNTWSHFWGDNRKYLFIIYWHARWFMKILRKTEIFRVTLGHNTTMPNALLPENKCSDWPKIHKS